MSTSAGQVGMARAEAKDYAAALPMLDLALKSSKNPAWLIARAKCHISQGNHSLGLRDAEAAYHSAASRGSRPLMTEAQYRRAVCLLRLGRPADADACAFWTMKLAEGVALGDDAMKIAEHAEAENGGFWRPDREALLGEIRDVTAPESRGNMASKRFGAIWNTAAALRAQIIGKLDNLRPEDEGRRITASFNPPKPKEGDEKGGKADVAKKTGGTSQSAQVPAAEKPKAVRVDFFQSNTNISVSLFVKGVPKEEFQAEMTPDKVSLSHIPGHEPRYEIPLYGTIDPAQSKYTVTPNKVELSLRKAEATKWPTLQRDTGAPAPAPAQAPAPAPAPAATGSAPSTAAPAPGTTSAAATAKDTPAPSPTPVPASTSTSAGPSYPTSSRSGPKDWDKVLDDEDTAGEEGESVNAFFKTLYKDATDEQKRAMMKSFVESNGTSLSTNWEDVKNGVVETKPPEGVEAKKWD